MLVLWFYSLIFQNFYEKGKKEVRLKDTRTRESAVLWDGVQPVRTAALGKAWETQSANFLDLTQRLPRRMFPLTAGGWDQALRCGGQWQNDRKSLVTPTSPKEL